MGRDPVGADGASVRWKPSCRRSPSPAVYCSNVNVTVQYGPLEQLVNVNPHVAEISRQQRAEISPNTHTHTHAHT